MGQKVILSGAILTTQVINNLWKTIELINTLDPLIRVFFVSFNTQIIKKGIKNGLINRGALFISFPQVC